MALATTPSMRSPDNIDELRERIEATIAKLEAVPVTNRKFIGRLIDHMCEILGSKAPGEVALATYFAELEVYPQALLVEAFKRVSRTHKYPRFPYIADFLHSIKEEIADQKRLHTRLHIMLKLLR